MICADSSSLIAYLSNGQGEDIARIDRAMDAQELHIPPPVISELLSSHRNKAVVEAFLFNAPVAPLMVGFWERAGRTRAMLRTKGYKAAMLDSFVAQCCIDANARLITRDGDFDPFAKWCGLKLAS